MIYIILLTVESVSPWGSLAVDVEFIGAGLHKAVPCQRWRGCPHRHRDPRQDVHNPPALHARAVMANTDAEFRQKLSLVNSVFNVVGSHR